jgi:hypothetical protein
MFIYLLVTRPASHGYNADNNVFLCYVMHVLYIFNLPIESLYLLKNCPLRSFKDISIHRDRQREATLLYSIL